MCASDIKRVVALSAGFLTITCTMPHSLAAKFSPDTRRLADELAIPAAARLLRLINELEDLASSGNADEDDTASYAEDLADALVRRAAPAVRPVLTLPADHRLHASGRPRGHLALRPTDQGRRDSGPEYCRPLCADRRGRGEDAEGLPSC